MYIEFTLSDKINVVFIYEAGGGNLLRARIWGQYLLPQFICETEASEVMVIIICSYVPHSMSMFPPPVCRINIILL